MVKDFTIMFSNCWVGAVYEDLKLPDQTPTIGLFFYAPCYLELLQNLKTNSNLTLTFATISKYEDASTYRDENCNYPIGVLGDTIEIQFLHYKTEAEAEAEAEAEDKRERRNQRINWDNLFIACTDRDGMTKKLTTGFDE
jgi:uncharacterized protein (DUF1919 family)